jgi:hypothetical protein
MALCVVLSAGLASAQPLPDEAAKMAQANADLDRLAQDLIKLVTHPGFRGFLRSEIAQSKNRKNILEVDKFLERALRGGGMPPELAKFRNFAREGARDA